MYEKFKKITKKPYGGYIRSDLSLDGLISFFTGIDQILEQNHYRIIKKNSGRVTLKYPLFTEMLLPESCMKIYFSLSGYRLYRFQFRPIPFYCWESALHLEELNIKTAKPLAVIKSNGQLWSKSILVMEWLEGFLNLNQFIHYLQKYSTEKHKTFIEKLGKFISLMHKKHVYHCDLHGGNILVRESRDSNNFEFVVIDLERIRFCKRENLRYLIYDLIKITFPVFLSFNGDTRQSFFKEYFNNNRDIADVREYIMDSVEKGILKKKRSTSQKLFKDIRSRIYQKKNSLFYE